MSERLRLRRLREFNSQYLTIRQQIQEAEERGLTDRAQRLRRLEVWASGTESAIR